MQEPWVFTIVAVTGGLLLAAELMPRLLRWFWKLSERQDQDDHE